MFSEKVQERLALLDSILVTTSDKALQLTETKTNGEARVWLHLKNPCILFSHLEDKKLQYFVNQKCADYVMYEYAEGTWKTHIFELKRSIGEKKWELKWNYQG